MSYLQITDSGERRTPKLLTHQEPDPVVIRVRDHVEDFRYIASRLKVDVGVLSRAARDTLTTLAPLESELAVKRRKILAVEALLSAGVALISREPYQRMQLEALRLQKRITELNKTLRGIWLEQRELETVDYVHAHNRHVHAERVARRVARMSKEM